MKNTGSITNGSFMTADAIKQANDVAQNVFIALSDAVKDASVGGDYSANWEKAQSCQMELLRLINDIKYKQNTKPKGSYGQQAAGSIEC